MFSVLALTVLIANPSSTPYTTVTPAPLHVVSAPTPAPVPSPTPNFNAFENVTLGDTSAAVRAKLGKPFEVDPVNIGEMWRYYADGGNSRLSVILAAGAVLSVTLSPREAKKSTAADPYGVLLGMSVDQLTSLRGQPITVADNGNRAYGDLAGVRWVYGFDAGLISDINVSEPLRAAPTSASTPAPSALDLTDGRDGSSAERAIVVNAASSGAGTSLENRYIKGLTCGLGGTWNVLTQTTVASGARWLDEITLSCPVDNTTQRFYFDVTSYAGK